MKSSDLSQAHIVESNLQKKQNGTIIVTNKKNEDDEMHFLIKVDKDLWFCVEGFDALDCSERWADIAEDGFFDKQEQNEHCMTTKKIIKSYGKAMSLGSKIYSV